MIAFALAMSSFIGFCAYNEAYALAAFGASVMVGVMLTVIIELMHDIMRKMK